MGIENDGLQPLIPFFGLILIMVYPRRDCFLSFIVFRVCYEFLSWHVFSKVYLQNCHWINLPTPSNLPENGSNFVQGSQEDRIRIISIYHSIILTRSGDGKQKNISNLIFYSLLPHYSELKNCIRKNALIILRLKSYFSIPLC